MTRQHRNFHKTSFQSLLENRIVAYLLSRKNQVIALCIFLIAGLFLASCMASGASQPTPDINSTVAAIAQTVVVDINRTMAAAVPATPTPSPTFTPSSATPSSVALSPIMSVTASPVSYFVSAGCNNLRVIDTSISAVLPPKPGHSFTQSWRVENNGTCKWDSSYHLVFVSGNQLYGSPGGLTQIIPPGKSASLFIDFIAPSQDGVYESAWRLSDSSGTPFGETLSMSIALTNNSEPASTPNKTATYEQAWVAEMGTAGAVSRQTAEAYMTSDFARLMTSVAGSSTAIMATNEALASGTPQP
jgi:hypothetical protein